MAVNNPAQPSPSPVQVQPVPANQKPISPGQANVGSPTPQGNNNAIAAFNNKQAKKKASNNPQQAPNNQQVIAKRAASPKSQQQIDREEKERLEYEAKLRRRESENAFERNYQTVQDINEHIGEQTEGVRTWLKNVPTPGGIATVLLILIFFTLAVIPVDKSGTTRLKLLWLVLTGKTHMQYQENESKISPPSNPIAGVVNPNGGGGGGNSIQGLNQIQAWNLAQFLDGE